MQLVTFAAEYVPNTTACLTFSLEWQGIPALLWHIPLQTGGGCEVQFLVAWQKYSAMLGTLDRSSIRF